MLKVHFNFMSKSIEVLSSGHLLERLHFQTKVPDSQTYKRYTSAKRFIMATVPWTLLVCALSTATAVSTPALSLGSAQMFVQ